MSQLRICVLAHDVGSMGHRLGGLRDPGRVGDLQGAAVTVCDETCRSWEGSACVEVRY